MAKNHGSISREPTVIASIALIFIGLLLFVVLPLYSVFEATVIRSGALDFTLYRQLFQDRSLISPFWNSLSLGAAVAVAGTLVGYVLAYIVCMTSVPFPRAIRFLGTFPMISPPFIIALAAIMLLGRNGVMTQAVLVPLFGEDALPSIYGFWGLLLVETLTLFPTSFLLMVALFQSIDPVLEEAAQNQGASPFRTFRDVIFPLSIPGVLSSLLLLFIESLSDFGNPLLLGGDFKVLSVAAYLKITGEYDTAGGAILALLLLVPSLTAFFIQKYYVERKSYATVLGKPSSSRRPRSSPLGRIFASTIAALLVGMVVLFYSVVIYGSFVKVWGVKGSGFTIANYSDALSTAWGSLSDSLILAAISTPITGIFGMIAAYLLVRKAFPGKKLMSGLSLLTFAVPGTVVGIGYILAFNEPPVQLTGTAAIIILLFVFRNAPVGIEAGMTAIRQIDRAIEEGSANLGASSAVTFRRIVLPLISPAFFTGLAHSFVRCMTAVSAVVFVVSGQWNLVTVSILGFVENSYLSRASAMCMILVALVSVVLLLMQAMVSRMSGMGRMGVSR